MIKVLFFLRAWWWERKLWAAFLTWRAHPLYDPALAKAEAQIVCLEHGLFRATMLQADHAWEQFRGWSS